MKPEERQLIATFWAWALMAKSYSERLERIAQTETSAPQFDEAFEKAIRQWCLEHTGLRPPDALDQAFVQSMRKMARELGAPPFLRWDLDLWFKEDLKELLRSGVL